MTSSTLALTITRVFNAPVELVFEVWTDPEHLKRWCCPKGFTIPFSEGDVHERERFRTCMRAPDGTDYWLGGVYREIVPNERLVFSHAWEDTDHETLVTVTFEDRDGKTLLTLHQEFFTSIPSRDGHAEGWNETLDNLEAYLVSNR